MMSLRHGERAVVRTRSPERVRNAAVEWINGLCTNPSGVALRSATAVEFENRIGLVPRFATADLGLLETLAPLATTWIDAPWIEVATTGQLKTANRTHLDGHLHAIGLDRGYLELDLSTPARRTAALLRYLTAPDPDTRFEGAVLLARNQNTRWATVNTEDSRASCRRLAEFVFESS